VDTTAGVTAEGRQPELERRVAELEAANADLRRTNQRLARERLTALDSAAASVAPKLDDAEAELRRVKGSLSWRLTAPFRWPKTAIQALLRRVKPYLRAIAVRVMR
jgi:hypothetical protein